MGFLFSNISQLADFFVSDQKNAAKSSAGIGLQSQLPEFDFKALLSECINSELPNAFPRLISKISENNTGNAIPEYADHSLQIISEEKIRTSLPFNIVAGAINAHEVPIVLHFRITRDEINSSEIEKSNHSDSSGVFDAQANPSSSARSDVKIWFIPAQVLQAEKSPGEEIAIKFASDKCEPQTKFVKIADLIDLIARYPEPITVEISSTYDQTEIRNLLIKTDNVISVEKNHAIPRQLKSAFVFDFRQLLPAARESIKPPIDGIIIQSNMIDQSFDNNPATPISGERQESKLLIQNPILKAVSIEQPKPLKVDNDILPSIEFDEKRNSDIIRFEQITKNPPLELFSSPARGRNEINKNGGTKTAVIDFESFANEFSQSIIKTELGQKTDKDFIADYRLPIKEPKAQKIPEKNSDSIRPQDGLKLSNSQTLSKTFQTAPRQSFNYELESLKNAIIEAVNNNTSVVKLRLQPERLGNINIKLHFTGDVISIRIYTDKKETAEIIKSAIPELKTGLEGLNIKVQEIVSIPNGHCLTSNSNNPGNGFREGDSPAGNPRNFTGQFKEENHRQYQTPDKSENQNLTHRSKINSNRWVDYEA